MHIFNAGGSARWGPVPFMKKIDLKFSMKFLLKNQYMFKTL